MDRGEEENILKLLKSVEKEVVSKEERRIHPGLFGSSYSLMNLLSNQIIDELASDVMWMIT